MSTGTFSDKLPSLLDELTRDSDVQLHEITPRDLIKLIEKYPDHACEIRLFATLWQIALISDEGKRK